MGGKNLRRDVEFKGDPHYSQRLGARNNYFTVSLSSPSFHSPSTLSLSLFRDPQHSAQYNDAVVNAMKIRKSLATHRIPDTINVNARPFVGNEPGEQP